MNLASSRSHCLYIFSVQYGSTSDERYTKYQSYMFLCAFINGTKTDVHVVFCIMVGWFPRTIGNLCNMPTFDDLIGVQVDSCILIFLRPLTVNIQISYAVNQDCIKLVLILAKYAMVLCAIFLSCWRLIYCPNAILISSQMVDSGIVKQT